MCSKLDFKPAHQLVQFQKVPVQHVFDNRHCIIGDNGRDEEPLNALTLLTT